MYSQQMAKEPFIVIMGPYIQSRISRISVQETSSNNTYSQMIRNYSNEDSQPLEEIDSDQQSSQLKVLTDKDRLRQFYHFDFSLHLIKFPRKRRYSRLIKFLYLNTYHLVRYLQKNNCSLQHVAKHYAQNRLAKIQHEEKFELFVERGQTIRQDYINNSLQEEMLQYLRRLGPKAILRWIGDIAQGIAELESLGIYHADLAFRNTIRVVKYNPQGIFKIIDFDKAFVVTRTVDNYKAFKYTEEIIDYWLRFRFDRDHPRQPISRISLTSQKSGSQISEPTKTIYQEDDLIAYMFSDADQGLIERLKTIKLSGDFNSKRLPQCLQLIQEYSKQDHFDKFKQLVQKLMQITFRENGKDQIQKQVQRRLAQLSKDRNYNLFATLIGQIRQNDCSSKKRMNLYIQEAQRQKDLSNQQTRCLQKQQYTDSKLFYRNPLKSQILQQQQSEVIQVKFRSIIILPYEDQDDHLTEIKPRQSINQDERQYYWQEDRYGECQDLAFKQDRRRYMIEDDPSIEDGIRYWQKYLSLENMKLANFSKQVQLGQILLQNTYHIIQCFFQNSLKSLIVKSYLDQIIKVNSKHFNPSVSQGDQFHHQSLTGTLKSKTSQRNQPLGKDHLA